METSIPAEVASPISQLLPYLTAAFSALKLAGRVAARALRPIRSLSPAPALLYLLAPVFVFLDITATLFLRTPYRTAIYLLDAAFPLYVFVGVACITGGILGLTARVLSRVIVVSLDAPPVDVVDALPKAGLPIVKSEPAVDAVEPRKRGKRVEKPRVGS
ncbi:hypothetical protein HYPSUDRAFT_65753 [Hypholoma sublateritium FD-334 SS-4]|uniref:Uncharacterized protein n=1 Tax=Hypholoma sublateritium (strain FD-334 SS-4) TaxID=945553 RepID=A0A0D2P020_HYPSF|nr:hypothetical protein HYPSUDRAFT_65753 [Hypholoma sublateritium FD-334 SS-4]